MNVLFVCSKNKWRSLTAETIFKGNRYHQVKSAGTDDGARIKLTEKLIEWADIIFVMEKKHLHIINQKFHAVIKTTKIIILEIPDEYQYMDEELVLSLQVAVSPYLDPVL